MPCAIGSCELCVLYFRPHTYHYPTHKCVKVNTNLYNFRNISRAHPWITELQPTADLFIQLFNIRYNYGDPTKIIHHISSRIWVVRAFEANITEIDCRYDSIENPPFPRSSTVKLWKVLLLCDRLWWSHHHRHHDQRMNNFLRKCWNTCNSKIENLLRLEMCMCMRFSLLGSAHVPLVRSIVMNAHWFAHVRLFQNWRCCMQQQYLVFTIASYT